MQFQNSICIENIFRDCIGIIKVNAYDRGTAFFISPGIILTCLHVIVNDYRYYEECELKDKIQNLNISFQYKNSEYECVLEKIIYTSRSSEIEAILLSVFISEKHPYVSILDEIPNVGSQCYVFGYPLNNNLVCQKNKYIGDSLTLEYEGPTYLDPSKKNFLFKFKDGQVKPGYSGSPVLNLETGYVCGIVKSTRNDSSNLGGRAIPIGIVTKEIKEFKNIKNKCWESSLLNTPKYKNLYKNYFKKREVLNYLKNTDCVNIITPKYYKVDNIISDICKEINMAEIDFASGITCTRKRFIKEILLKLNLESCNIPDVPHDLEFFEDKIIKGSLKYLYFKHFDMVKVKKECYDTHFFGSLRYLTMEMVDSSKKLVLLIQSHKPITELLPEDHPMSGIEAKIVRFKGEGNEN